MSMKILLILFFLQCYQLLVPLRFFTAGDWGCDCENQHAVAITMAKRASVGPPVKFVVGLGDHFYTTRWGKSGNLTTPTDIRFQKTFHEVYDSKLLNKWYMILGNHDIVTDQQNNLILHTKYSNGRWYEPAAWFDDKIKIEGTNTLVHLIFLDTMVAECLNDPKCDRPRKYNRIGFSTTGAKEQLYWFEETLKNSTADWIFVFGHYNIYSGGRVPVPKMLQYYVPLFQKYKVNAYFNGHDHQMSHCRVNDVDYFNNGASGLSYGDRRGIGSIPAGGHLYGPEGGGAHTEVEVYDDHFTVYYVKQQLTSNVHNPHLLGEPFTQIANPDESGVTLYKVTRRNHRTPIIREVQKPKNTTSPSTKSSPSIAPPSPPSPSPSPIINKTLRNRDNTNRKLNNKSTQSTINNNSEPNNAPSFISKINEIVTGSNVDVNKIRWSILILITFAMILFLPINPNKQEDPNTNNA